MRRALVIAAVLGFTLLSPAHGQAPAPGADHPQAGRHREIPDLRVRKLVNGFRFPWDVQQLPSGSMLVTERNRAKLTRVTHGQRRMIDFPSQDVWVAVETGLMSMAIDPDFRTNRRIYTCQGATTATGHDVRVIAWKLIRRRASHPETVLAGIPDPTGHHAGCRLLIDRETGALLVGTGDGRLVDNARNLDTLGGKVVRLNRLTGAPWPDNPWFTEGGNRAYIYTFGHRNVQGLAQRDDGTIWSVEHGTDRNDEVNLLRPGGDYGWDPGPGYDEFSPMTDHLLPGGQRDARWTSGFPTLATSGATWVEGEQWGALDGTLAVAALKTQQLLFMKFDADGVFQWVQAPDAAKKFGRLRSVTRAANGDLLVTTSNGGLDHVLRVSPR